MDSKTAVSQLSENASVAEFYAGKSIFLTGATGFVGKLFMEKVLRSCPDVEGIYCLVRAKRGKTAIERIDHICQSQAFQLLRKSNPEFRTKIHVIEGDIQSGGNLGMTETEIDFLRDNIHIIVHSAADLSFGLSLTRAIQRNVLPTKAMIALAGTLTNLEVFVYVSTAYANCDRLHEILEEKIYTSEITPRDMITITSCLDETSVDKVLPSIIGNHPNTYTFTKKLSENLLQQEATHLPLVVVRPTVIVGSHNQPMEGFGDQMSGFTACTIGFVKGFLNTSHVQPDVVLDIIPVDHCVNSVITGAWRKAVLEKDREATVYHVSSSQQNPITFGEFNDYGVKAGLKWPFENGIAEPSPKNYTTSRLMNYLSLIFLHLLPGFLVDIFLVLLGRKPMMVKIFLKLIKSTEALDYFTNNTWIFSSTNMTTLQSCLSPSDQQTFNMDVKSIDWPDYIETLIRGIKLYTLNEDVNNVEKTRLYYKRLKGIKIFIKTASIALFSVVIYMCIWN